MQNVPFLFHASVVNTVAIPEYLRNQDGTERDVRRWMLGAIGEWCFIMQKSIAFTYLRGRI